MFFSRITPNLYIRNANIWQAKGKELSSEPFESKQKEVLDPYLLVDLDANGALGDVPDLAGAAMIELVRHALVDGTIHLDIHVVSDLVRPQVRRQRDVALLSERPREQVPRARPHPVPGRHPCFSSRLPRRRTEK